MEYIHYRNTHPHVIEGSEASSASHESTETCSTDDSDCGTCGESDCNSRNDHANTCGKNPEKIYTTENCFSGMETRVENLSEAHGGTTTHHMSHASDSTSLAPALSKSSLSSGKCVSPLCRPSFSNEFSTLPEHIDAVTLGSSSAADTRSTQSSANCQPSSDAPNALLCMSEVPIQKSSSSSAPNQSPSSPFSTTTSSASSSSQIACPPPIDLFPSSQAGTKMKKSVTLTAHAENSESSTRAEATQSSNSQISHPDVPSARSKSAMSSQSIQPSPRECKSNDTGNSATSSDTLTFTQIFGNTLRSGMEWTKRVFLSLHSRSGNQQWSRLPRRRTHESNMLTKEAFLVADRCYLEQSLSYERPRIVQRKTANSGKLLFLCFIFVRFLYCNFQRHGHYYTDTL